MKRRSETFDTPSVTVQPDGMEAIVNNVRLLSSHRKHRGRVASSSFLSEYFRCQSSGFFVDEVMKNQGKFFFCYRTPTKGQTEPLIDSTRRDEPLTSFSFQNFVSSRSPVRRDFDFISRNVFVSNHSDFSLSLFFENKKTTIRTSSPNKCLLTDTLTTNISPYFLA